jgi:tetratricopeptide (TPR) repeat protein
MTGSQPSTNYTYLEHDAKFSESKIWNYQRSYFDSKGINAWVGGVPYYVTSNSVIAHSYAQVVFRYYQDGLRTGLINKEERLYIIELGTGPGRFSYQFLTFLNQFIENYATEPMNFCYVMTDFTGSNIEYWQNHERIKPLVEKGIVDFAIYDIGANQDIQLINQKITLSKNSCQNPLIVIANYIFDTVTHDVFRAKDGKLEEGLISLKTEQDNIASDEHLKNLDKLQTEFNYKEITADYYPDQNLNQVLAYYQENIKDTTFLIPTGAIQCINHLREISNNKLLIISADKGYTSMESLEGRGTPHIAFHGSFSMMVNFDALARYAELNSGDHCLASATEGIKLSLLSFGNKLDGMPETRWAYNEFIQRFCTKEFLLIKNELIDHVKELTLTEMLALMKLSYWDPDILVAIAPDFSEKIHQQQYDITFREELREGLTQVYKNFYYIPNYKNPIFAIAQLHHVIHDFELSLKLYEESIEKYGDNAATQMNMGVCYYYMKDNIKALRKFKTAIEMEPDNNSAKEWLKYLRENR